MQLAIFTHVIHREQEGSYSAYSPYIREMNLWLKYVQEVEVVAPAPQPPKWESSAKESYQHSHINFTKVPSFDLLDFTSSVKAVFRIPFIILKIARAMNRADHIHLRCPGNIGLLGCLVQIFFPHKPKTAKYAGNWDPKSKQPWSYKLQKWILSNTFLTRNMKVLVYGQWPNQTKNILPFFTASFKETEKEEVVKTFTQPYKFLFVGNLVKGKQPLFALKLVESLNKQSIPAELLIYGDGPLKNDLAKEAENKDYIHLPGNQPLEVIKQAYKDAHFLVLASKSEGWPKAVAEAMFFGCIPIATGVSFVPQMLNYGSRGILISDIMKREEVRADRGHPPAFGVRAGRSLPEPVGAGEDSQHVLKKDVPARGGVDSLDTLNDTVDRIMELLENPEEMRRMSMEAQEWSQEYTLEKFEAEIKKLLVPKER